MTCAWHRFAGRLALLAMLLTLLAPLAAQLRAKPSDWSWLSELACHDHSGQANTSTQNPAKPGPLDACGYCSLLWQSPALGNFDGEPLNLAVAHIAHASAQPQDVPRVRRMDRRSRAPPKSST